MIKITILMLVLLFAIFIPAPALATVEGLLTGSDDGSFHLYTYRELLDSYALKLIGQPNGLYEDFRHKTPLAFLHHSGSYIDYTATVDNYAAMILTGQKFSFDSYAQGYQAKKINAPLNFLIVSMSAGQLTRQMINNTQVGTPNTPGLAQNTVETTTDTTKPPEQEIGTSQTPIVAASQVTIDRAVAWAFARKAHQRFIEITPFYWEYGRLTGICPEVLYAQAAHETNFGHYTGQVPATYNNWAGIKTANAAGDKPEDHEQFATPQDGVKAHFNHMAAYVGLKPIGEQHGRYFVVTRLSWAGTVKSVEELSGKWAPSSTYHQRIISMLGEMRQ
jgi:hypothetical protein